MGGRSGFAGGRVIFAVVFTVIFAVVFIVIFAVVFSAIFAVVFTVIFAVALAVPFAIALGVAFAFNAFVGCCQVDGDVWGSVTLRAPRCGVL